MGKVTVSKSSPQLKNTALTINASASTGYSPSFKYSVYDGKKWSTIKNYSASKSAKWTPTKPGSYKLKVEVKSKKSKNLFDDQKIINYNIFETASINSVKTDKAGPQGIKTKVSFSAQSNNNKDNLFQFSVYKGNQLLKTQKYSPSSKMDWTPSQKGEYIIKVQVKHKWSKKLFDQQKTISYNIFEWATLRALKTDIVGPQPVNTKILVTAESNNNADNLFKFSIYNEGKLTLNQNYSKDSTISWIPTTAGEYKIKVHTKHRLSNKDDGTKEIIYEIYDPVKIDKIEPESDKLINK
ncbi:triple tyrosine motif-containing protein [Bacillus sp. V59.32b]|uniref:triple tyrosine motif-containing protein n=1 Tax=Bacillus sp. V59.32b TaxID=1758642 RepID=UPI0020B1137A|nr:triple tyrosine motif-containing protein [Bacillus sp. V59.32b]